MPAPAAAVTHDDLAARAGRARRRSRGSAARVGSRSCSTRGRSPGQAEHALGEDVALDLVGPAVDRVGAGEQEEPLPLVELVRRALGGQRRRCRAPPSPARRGSGASWPRRSLATLAVAGGPRAGLVPARVRSALSADHLELDVGAGEPVARCTGSSIAPLARARSIERVELAARSRPAGRGWRRRARSRAGPSRRAQPWPGSPTTRSASVRAPVKKTSLNSAAPVSCSIGRGPRRRPGPIGTSRKLSPWWRSRAGLGAGEHEAPVGELGQRGPHLLPVDDPARRRRGGPWSARWPGRSRRRARSSPGTTAPRRRGSRAGSAACCSASVPKAISVGPSSSSPRWLTRPGAFARAYSSWKITCWVRPARGRRARSASRCRSSRARRGAGPTPSRSSWASCSLARTRRGPAAPAKSPARLSSSQARTSARKASSSAESVRSTGSYLAVRCWSVRVLCRLPYQALVWALPESERRWRHRTPSPALLRAAAERTASSRAVVDGDHADLRRAPRPGPETARRLRRLRPRARRPGRPLGAEQRRAGWSPLSR